MKEGTLRTEKHVCPRNCPSTCTLFSQIENEQVTHIYGDKDHPYTDGKLCAKGFSYVEQNRHPERLKYPYFQKVKGSGKFKQISWKTAYQLIITEMKAMKKGYDGFLPLAWYKGSGNIGVHHQVTNEFFSRLGDTTQLIGGSPKIHEDFYRNSLNLRQYNPHEIADSSIIIIWGANPALTNIHLIPFLIDAKVRGAKIVVIDPIYTRTAELADIFIQLRPNTDEILAKLLTKKVIENDTFQVEYVINNTRNFAKYTQSIMNIDEEESLQHCDIPREAYHLLLNWFTKANGVSYVIGAGVQKQKNGVKMVRAIESLVTIQKYTQEQKIGLYFKNHDLRLFNNQRLNEEKGIGASIQISELGQQNWSQRPPINMLWFSGGNPLLQEADPKAFKSFMETVPFVVTVDHFMTHTAKMSNLILPTTTFFEEKDIVISPWHGEVFYNEKGVTPYFESKSEWDIMTELAKLLQHQSIGAENFPVFSSQEEYLNAQFNGDVYDIYGIRNVADLKNRKKENLFLKPSWENGYHHRPAKNYQFFVGADQKNKDLAEDSASMSKDYPFWLLTPHHPYKLNSQFHYLNLTAEKEACVEINPDLAEEYDLEDGQMVAVYNAQASIVLKCLYSPRLPKDILLIYPGWYPDSNIVINEFISHTQTSDPATSLRTTAYYNTFVNIEKF